MDIPEEESRHLEADRYSTVLCQINTKGSHIQAQQEPIRHSDIIWSFINWVLLSDLCNHSRPDIHPSPAHSILFNPMGRRYN